MFNYVESADVVAALCLTSMLAILTSALSLFLRYCFKHHPVGIWYFSMLEKLPVNLAKPLGKCVYCLNPWLFFASSFVLDLPLLLWLYGLGMNYLSLCYFDFLENKWDN